MGYKLGGIICDNCIIFKPYNDYLGKGVKYNTVLPDGWEKDNDILLCPICARKIKIEKCLKKLA